MRPPRSPAAEEVPGGGRAWPWPGIVGLLATLALAGGCSLLSSKSGLDADIEEAQRNMRDSKKDYEICLQERDDQPDSPCEEMKELYEDDRETYEALLRRKRAQPS